MKIVRSGISVDGGDFKLSVSKIVKEQKFNKIIETGTYLGLGTTSIIANSLNNKYKMYTIEVNPSRALEATKNLNKYKNIEVITGLSIPKFLLPNEEETTEFLNRYENIEGIWVDHQKYNRAQLYVEECDFDGIPDDCLGMCMKKFDYKPDLVMLDSAGHMGFIEFKYVLSLLKGSCVFILDDVNHVKHYDSLRLMKNDSRFNVLKISSEKFGFCIAEYNYQG